MLVIRGIQNIKQSCTIHIGGEVSERLYRLSMNTSSKCMNLNGFD